MEIPKFGFTFTPELVEACKKYNRDPKEFLPLRSESKATGWDVRSAEELEIKPGEYKMISLGIRMICPEGWWMEIKPRSSSFAKKQLNSLYGTIDFSYSGIMKFCVQYLPDSCALLHTAKNLKIEFGERIAQLIPRRLEDMETYELSNDDFERLAEERIKLRDPAGFGSSGRQ